MKNFERLGSVLPSEFTVVGYAYSQPIGDGDFEAEVDLDNLINEDDELWLKGELINMAHNKTNCNHCNKKIRYIIVAQHNGGTYHTFGHTCGTDLRNFKEQKIVGMQERSLASRKRAKNAEMRKSFLQANPGLEEALNANNKIIASMKENFMKYHSLSDKQIELVFKLVAQMAKFKEEAIIRNSTSSEVTEGRIKDQKMKVISIKKTQIQGFGYNSVMETYFVYTLEHESGFRIYGKIKGSYDFTIKDHKAYNEDNIKSNDYVIFSGSVTKSDKDPYFGFFKRANVSLIK